MDFLARWMASLMQLGAIRLPYRGISPCLFYADDSIFFFKPDLQQVGILKVILHSFQLISGLKVNPDKSELLMIGVDQYLTSQLAAYLGCAVSSFPLKFLGLPLSDKRLKKSDYNDLIDKFSKKLSGWTASLLSIGGRLVLLNSCLSSLPIYFMSCFKLPKWVIKEIDSMRRKFLWHGVGNDNRKMVFISWDTVCNPKSLGGLGVLDLAVMNDALLAKHLWNWYNPSRSWLKQLLLALGQNHPSTYPQIGQLSRAWNTVSNVLLINTEVELGRGTLALFWHHNWGYGILKYAMSDLFSFAIDPNITVSRFLKSLQQGNELFNSLLHSSTSAMDQFNYLIHHLDLSQRDLSEAPQDSFRWRLNIRDGSYTTKSYYNFVKAHPKKISIISKVWKFNIAPRIKIFVWQMLQDKLATIDNLKRRGWQLPNRCCLCKIAEESAMHLFQDCSYFITLKNHTICHDMDRDYLKALTLSPVRSLQKDILSIICFITWRERCSRIFREVVVPAVDLLDEIAVEWTAKGKETLTFLRPSTGIG